MRILRPLPRAVLFLSLCAPLAPSQEKPGFSGHWEGVLKTPNQDIQFTVDLAKNEKGEWVGSLSMPMAKGIPLSDVTVKEAATTFKLPISGGLAFEGKLSEDEKIMTGTLTQGGNTVPFELKRTGEAKVDTPPKSTAITQELEGTWEGVLEPPGQSLKLVLKLAKAADGTATGTMESVNQNATIPITTITQEGSGLSFEIRIVGGSYTGKLNEAKTELAGEWSQGGMKLPLTFKRSQPKQ